MHDRSEVFNIVAGYGYFFFWIAVHREEERSVILCFYFINHGEVDDVTFMSPKKSLLGKKCFGITESHFRAYDAFGGIEKGIIRFFGGNQDDFFCGRKNECLVFVCKEILDLAFMISPEAVPFSRCIILSKRRWMVFAIRSSS